MENWVKLIRQVQGANNPDSPNLYADEVLRRLRLDLVEIEQETLASPASIDRVRECFRALIRSLEITDDDDDDDDDGEDFFSVPPPTRNMFCVVLDAKTVHTLSNLTFGQGHRTGSGALTSR